MKKLFSLLWDYRPISPTREFSESKLILMIMRFNPIEILTTEDILKEINMVIEVSKIKEVIVMMRKEIRLTSEMKEIKQEALKKENIVRNQDNELGVKKIEMRFIEITQDQKGKNKDQIKEKMNY